MEKPKFNSEVSYSGWRLDPENLKWVREISALADQAAIDHVIRQLVMQNPSKFLNVSWMIVKETIQKESMEHVKIVLANEGEEFE